jgi:nitrogen-specific signal transduction histidine kinase/CheY-like chemotaxis protein
LIRGDDGEIVRVVGTAQDITQRRELEHQFRQAQKLDAIGQLAGGVAHDFNNILAAIVMQADFASHENISPVERRKLLSEIRASSDRAATLTRQLLALSSRQILQPHRLNLNELVGGITAMLRRILGEHISVSVDLHPDPLFTRADAGMIDQVLLNLAVNARDAMPSGGQLTISTGVCELSQEGATRIQRVSAGRHVQLVVQDTGEGIAPDTLPRIFEPFFTTKPRGKGTGLGLATVYGIVKQHEGGISVESEPGRGTTFRILLRPDDVASEDSSPHASPATPRRGAETILLVEDDDQVRRLMRRVLERHGYTVLTARDGPQALSTFERHADEIELLFSDIVMPGGLSGRQLAEECQRKKPSLRVIFTSGFSPDFGGRELSLAPGQRFIQKPAPSRELLSVVRQSLDS